MFKKIIILASIFGVFGLFGFLYTQIWDPLWNPFRPGPEIVLAEMSANLSKVKTLRTQADFEIDGRDKTDAFLFTISGDIEANIDNTDFESFKTAANFDIVFSAEEMEFSLTGETRTIGDISYFKLTAIPSLPFLEPMFAAHGIDLKEFKNQWIKVDKENIEKITGKKYAETEKENQKEIIKEITGLLQGKTFFKVEEEFADAEFEGKIFYHYLISLDKDIVQNIMPEIIDAITAEIWINKKDHLPYKIEVAQEIEVNVNLSNFNQPVKIEPPESFKTLDEL